MLRLENRELRVDLLDPAADAARQGWRYCWGGYVWQVHDRAAGPLLAGPEWPGPAPSAFNGQGLPESFRHQTRDGQPFTWDGAAGLAVGAGSLARDEQGRPVLVAPGDWTVTPFADHLVFQARPEGAGISCELTRKVELIGRDVNSFSRLTNVGDRPLRLQWFPHPFFALTDGRARVEFRHGARMPENAGFALADGVLTFKRRFADQNDGQFVLCELTPGRELRVVIDHPVLTHVEFTTSFVPDECPVWGNGNTFSVEPYLNLDLAPGATRHWSVHYRFGAARQRG